MESIFSPGPILLSGAGAIDLTDKDESFGPSLAGDQGRVCSGQGVHHRGGEAMHQGRAEQV